MPDFRKQHGLLVRREGLSKTLVYGADLFHTMLHVSYCRNRVGYTSAGACPAKALHAERSVCCLQLHFVPALQRKPLQMALTI